MPQAISSLGWHQNKIFIGLLWIFTCAPPPQHPHTLPIHPSVEDRDNSHGLPLWEEFARLQIRFSGICNVNDTLGSCVKREGMATLCACVCLIGLLCKATTRLLHFPWACDSLIKYSYMPCKYMENTVNPQSAVCPPAQMLFHVFWQKSPNVPSPPCTSLLPIHPFIFLSISQTWRMSLVLYCCILDVPVLSTQPVGRPQKKTKRHGRTHRSDGGSKWCLYVFWDCFSMVEKRTDEGFFFPLHPFSPLPWLPHRRDSSRL